MSGRKLLQFWIIGTVVIWAAVYAVGTAQNASAPLVRPVERWQLPPMPERLELGAAANSLAASPVWGAAAPANAGQATPVEDPRWSIGGVYFRNGVPTVVVRFAAAKHERLLTIGDAVPDGSRIVGVTPDYVCVAKGHKQRRLNVYDSKLTDC